MSHKSSVNSKHWVVTGVPVPQLRCLSRRSLHIGFSRTVTLFTVSLPTNTVDWVVACRQLLFCCADCAHKNRISAKQTWYFTWHQHHLRVDRVPFVWWWMSQSVRFRTKLVLGVCVSVCSPHTQVCDVTYRSFQNTKRFQKRTNNNEDTFVYVRCQNGLFKVWKYHISYEVSRTHS